MGLTGDHHPGDPGSTDDDNLRDVAINDLDDRVNDLEDATGGLLASNNLSDLANAVTARSNLGLGNAATKATGTTAGSVMAGDDSRVVGALQKDVADAAGDLFVGTAADTIARKAIGSNGKLLRVNTGQSDKLQYASLVVVDTFANRPLANAVLPETIFVDTDSGANYQSNGVDTWTWLFGGTSDRLLPDGEMALSRNALSGSAGNSIGIATQQIKLTYFTAGRTELITQVRMYIGSTAAGATPTHTRIGVWTADDAGALTSQVAATADDTSLLTGSTSSRRTKVFGSSWTKTRGVRYAVGVWIVTSAATPTFGGSFIDVTQESGDSQRVFGSVASQSSLPSTVVAGSVGDTSSGPQFHLLQ